MGRERCKKFVSGTGMLRSTIKGGRPSRVSFLALFPIRLTENALHDFPLLSGTELDSIVDLSQLCAPNQLASGNMTIISMKNEPLPLYAPRMQGVSK